MTITTLKERIQKVEAKIAKKENTIQKKQGWIASGKKDESECSWLQEDIVRLSKEIAEAKNTLDKYNNQLAGAIERESILITEIPEVLKSMQDQLVEEWDAWDIRRKTNLQAKYQELGWKKFFEAGFSRADYEFKDMSSEQIHNNNIRNAKDAIIDLYSRVKDIIGEVTDWSGITTGVGATALNGLVIGKEGRAKVESITAGGYNIQRLHIRILVHSI